MYAAASKPIAIIGAVALGSVGLAVVAFFPNVSSGCGSTTGSGSGHSVSSPPPVNQAGKGYEVIHGEIVDTGSGQSSINAPIRAVATVHGAVDTQLALAMHYGTNIETNGNPFADSSDGGYGWYRIQKWPIDWHPDISIAETRNPVDATEYMAPAYRQSLAIFNRKHAGEWKTDPMLAADAVAVGAEHPSVDYRINRPDDVPLAYAKSLKELQVSGIHLNFTSKAAGSSNTVVSTYQGGCQAPAPGSGQVVPPGTSYAEQRQTAMSAADSALGTMYAWAGGTVNGPTQGVCEPGTAAANDCNIRGFDCSGLVLYVLGQGLGKAFVLHYLQHNEGVHSAADQYRTTQAFTVADSPSGLNRARPGDLVFFTGDDGSFSNPGHVGIYIGNGRMIDAPESGEVVQVADIAHSAFWQSEFIAVTDPFAWAAAQRGTKSA